VHYLADRSLTPPRAASAPVAPLSGTSLGPSVPVCQYQCGPVHQYVSSTASCHHLLIQALVAQYFGDSIHSTLVVFHYASNLCNTVATPSVKQPSLGISQNHKHELDEHAHNKEEKETPNHFTFAGPLIQRNHIFVLHGIGASFCWTWTWTWTCPSRTGVVVISPYFGTCIRIRMVGSLHLARSGGFSVPVG